jgi:hypothetical protein
MPSPAEALSTALFRETRGTRFFGVLTGRNAPFYVDVLDEMEREMGERADGLPREEVLRLIVDAIERHPDMEWVGETEEPETETRESRDKARLVLEHLVSCRWLEEPPRRDWRRNLHFDPHGATVLAALRKVAWPEAAVFTDKLLAVCALLANEIEISERPWQLVENCLASLRDGLNELRAMQKSLQRFTRRQLEEDTLQGNLAVVFDDYAEQVSHACYAELVRARLPLRLPEAVDRIHRDLSGNASAMDRMITEVLRRHPDQAAATARAVVSNALDELTTLLDRVLPMADEIDRRTADFTRRSLARFRYLQEVTGERRAEMRNVFNQINALLAGRKFAAAVGDLPELPGFLLPAVKLPSGLDSLYAPPARRAPVDQDAFDDSLNDADRADGLRDMESALRDALSVQRANSFVAALPGGKGDRVTSMELAIDGEKGYSDLISLLLHAESAEARYRIEVERVTDESQPPPLDPLAGAAVERFGIIKK